MVTEERRREIAEQVTREQKRLKDKPTGVWAPQLTEEEKEQRKKDIDAAVIPF